MGIQNSLCLRVRPDFQGQLPGLQNRQTAAELRFTATQRDGRVVMPAHIRKRIAHAAYEQVWLEFCRVPNLTDLGPFN